MKTSSIVLSFVIASCAFHDANAALSIAAAENTTGQIGAAGTTCDLESFYGLAYHAVPGHGVCLVQGVIPGISSLIYTNIDLLLSNDTAPLDILGCITDPLLDTGDITVANIFPLPSLSFNLVNLRQYGCVNLDLLAAGYTGNELDAYYSAVDSLSSLTGLLLPDFQQHLQGLVGNTLVYSAQGSHVSSASVTTLSTTFSSVSACDLAERLYLTLAAVYEVSTLLGDVNCLLNGAPGSSIFLHIDAQDGSEIIHIESIAGALFDNPWLAFKTAYDAWRVVNPCPAPASLTTSPSTNLVSHCI